MLHVQASLRALGPVPGGAETVVRALLEALGDEGTLVAYTATPENSVTSRIHQAETAGLSAEGVDDYRARMPRFDPATTPSSPTMGTLSEAIRTHPGALRSAHPQTSWAAIGPHARTITSSHPLNCHLGPESPLGRLYDLDAQVLTIGVPIARFTGFHLADLRMPDVPQREYRCVGAEGWTTFKAPDLDDLHFADLGAEVLAASTTLSTRSIGAAHCRLISLREAVDLAERVLRRTRS